MPGPRSARASAATNQERWHQVHDLLNTGVGLLECAHRPNLAFNTVKRYARVPEPERLIRARACRPTLVGPYHENLRKRRAEGIAVLVLQLLKDLKDLGYTGSQNLLCRYITQGRVESERSHLFPRRVTRLLVTKPENLSDRDRELAGKLAATCPEMTALAEFTTAFAQLLCPHEDNADHLAEWIAAVRRTYLPHLQAFTRGPTLTKTLSKRP